MKIRNVTAVSAWAIVLLSTPLNAAPIEFDCDVPANRYSSISNQSDNSLSVSGIINSIELRLGRNLPVAGAFLGDLDEENSTTFQMFSPSKGAKQFDLVANIKRGDHVRKIQLGKIRSDKPVPFSMYLSKDGMVHLTVADQIYDYEFMSLSSGKEMLFCSTGQFKFSEVAFSDDRVSDAQEGLSP